MEYRLGIDPGLSGAVVAMTVYSTGVPVVNFAIPMPTKMVGKSRRVDAERLAEFMREWDSGRTYIEHVGAMPGQGVTSMFTFGHCAGAAEGVSAALCMPVTLVRPQVWKERAGIIGQGKDGSRQLAMKLWPNWSDLNKIGKGQAFADAALIAMFGE